MPRLTKTALGVLGHEGVDVRDIGLLAAADHIIGSYALKHDLAILTRDRGGANTRKYPPSEYPGIAVINLPFDATAKDVTTLLRDFMRRDDFVDQIPGKTIIISKDKVQVRTG